LDIMADGKTAEDATLLDLLVDGFEKNEILQGQHWRKLPMHDEGAARVKFELLVEEARRWMGEPVWAHEETGRRLARWTDLEIRQAGRGVMVRVRAPRFDAWWHDRETWAGDPMGPVHEWITEERP
jgi:hypothetical protein